MRTSSNRMFLEKALFLSLGLFPLLFGEKAFGQSYQDAFSLQQGIFSNYNPSIRPLLNQSHKIIITPAFTLALVLDVDEIDQSFVINGFIVLEWMDELLVWNPKDYGGIKSISPDQALVWKPKMTLLNTVNKRDIFQDGTAPIRLSNNGLIQWYPGGLVSTACALDLRKFPFDSHKCIINLLPMHETGDEIEYQLGEEPIRRVTISENGEWKVDDVVIEVGYFGPQERKNPVLQIDIFITRRPQFWVVTILLPVIFLCALNVLVFAIPASSGEKVSYNMAVVLAFSVYMSIVSEKLPSNSENMAYFTYYVFTLFIMSVVTCLVAICILWLSNKDQENAKRRGAKSNWKSAAKKLGIVNYLMRPKGRDSVAKETEGISTELKLPPLNKFDSRPTRNTYANPLDTVTVCETSLPKRTNHRLSRHSSKVIPLESNVKDVPVNETEDECREAISDGYYENLASTVNILSFASFCLIGSSLTLIFFVLVL